MGWQWLAWICITLLLLALVGIAVLLARSRALGRIVGSFECGWRPVGRSVWTSGVACYGVGRLDWYRTVSLHPAPSRRWKRVQLTIESLEPLSGASRTAMQAHCRAGEEEFYLALEGEALAGLTGWLEAVPPTHRGS